MPETELPTEALAALSVSEPAPQAVAPEEAPAPAPDTGKSTWVKYFVSVLPTTTEETLRAHFEAFGIVERVVVKHSFSDKRSFAFVTIDGDSDKIINTPHVIDGHAIPAPEFARSNGAGAMSNATATGKQSYRRDANKGGALKGGCRKIFVGGLSHQTHESHLRAHFEQFGRLTDVVVMHEAGGRKPRGFGFVTFADVASVQKVLQSRFHPVDGRGVEVKLAVPREMMSSDEAATGAELVGHGGEYGGTYPAGAPPYGEAVSGDPGEYAPSGYGAQYGYQPSVPYGYGYQPPMHMGYAPMAPMGYSPYQGAPAQGIRVLYGTEQMAPYAPPGGVAIFPKAEMYPPPMHMPAGAPPLPHSPELPTAEPSPGYFVPHAAQSPTYGWN